MSQLWIERTIYLMVVASLCVQSVDKLSHNAAPLTALAIFFATSVKIATAGYANWLRERRIK